MKEYTLAQLLEAASLQKTGSLPESALAGIVKGIKNDSRRIEPDDLFIAIPGFETDGHRYLKAAEGKGALAAVVEVLHPETELPQICVENSRKAQADLAACFYGDPTSRLNLCGVTGSNGKTSTSLMYKSIVEASGESCGLVGTVEYQTGQSKVESKLTTPDSPDLQRYFMEMADSGFHYAVMEVSSIGQTQYRNRGCHYKVASFINLGREHLDFHGSMESYFEAKKQLIVNLDADAAAVLNEDDEYSRSLRGETKAKVLSFGLSERADVRCTDLDLSSGFAVFNLLLKPNPVFKTKSPDTRSFRVALKVPGFHSVMNALAAIAMGLANGFSPECCIRGIENYRGVERRFQEIYAGDFRIFDDHFANAGNIDMTLETLSKMDYDRLVLVYAIRGNRGVTVNRENVEAVIKWLPKLRLERFIASLSRDTTGHYDRVSDEEIDVFKTCMKEGGPEYTLFENLDEAVRSALQSCQKGDLMLLAGCQGMDAGARLVLTALSEAQPDKKEAIMAVLKDRVCGW